METKNNSVKNDGYSVQILIFCLLHNFIIYVAIDSLEDYYWLSLLLLLYSHVISDSLKLDFSDFWSVRIRRCKQIYKFQNKVFHEIIWQAITSPRGLYKFSPFNRFNFSIQYFLFSVEMFLTLTGSHQIR